MFNVFDLGVEKNERKLIYGLNEYLKNAHSELGLDFCKNDAFKDSDMKKFAEIALRDGCMKSIISVDSILRHMRDRHQAPEKAIDVGRKVAEQWKLVRRYKCRSTQKVNTGSLN